MLRVHTVVSCYHFFKIWNQVQTVHTCGDRYLPIYRSIHLFIYLSILSKCIYLNVSIYLSIHPSIHLPSIHQSIHLSINLSIYSPIWCFCAFDLWFQHFQQEAIIFPFPAGAATVRRAEQAWTAVGDPNDSTNSLGDVPPRNKGFSIRFVEQSHKHRWKIDENT